MLVNISALFMGGYRSDGAGGHGAHSQTRLFGLAYISSADAVL